MISPRSTLVLLVAVLTVASPFMALNGHEPGTTDPARTGATPLAPTEQMLVTVEGHPDDSATFDAMEDLTYSGVGFSPPVGGKGYLVSVNHTVHEGKRWDYAVGVVRVPQGRVTLEVRDPDGSTFPDDPVLLRSAAAPGGDSVSVDLRDIDPDEHVRLQFSFVLDHTGDTGTPPHISGWVIGQSDPDLWHDPFHDVGRDDSREDLIIGEGSCRPIGTHKPGGLLGDYYDNSDFTGFEYQRLDQRIDFDWGNGGPGGGVGSNTFSIDWNGKIMIPVDDTYNFHLRVDDGGRLWIDGVRIINEWYDQSPTEHSASRYLTAGLHDIRINMYENRGGATCELRWSSSTIAKGFVPHTALWGRETTNVLVSEDIQLPDDHAWDLLLFDIRGGSEPVWYDLFDAHTDLRITGYQCLTAPVMDLSKLSAGLYPRIKLRARWSDGDTAVAPELLMWGVKWMPERTWRDEFLTDLRMEGSVGLARDDGYVLREGTDTHTSIYAFAEPFDGETYFVDSSVHKGEYWQAGIPTINATDVAMGDLDGDGLDDLVYTHGSVGVNATGHRATAGGFSTTPTWTFPLLRSHTPRFMFTDVDTFDMDGDGRVDVVTVIHDVSDSQDRILIHLNNGSAFNDTPDKVILYSGNPITSISLGDIDGDGKGDIATGYGGELGFCHVIYGSDGWTSADDKRLNRSDVLTVHVGDLNGDDYDDLFVGANVSQPQRPNNMVYYGSSTGIPDDPDATFDTPPSFGATYADWNGDTLRDVVFLTEDKVRVYIQGTQGYLVGVVSDRSGVVDIATIRAGGDADEDVAFAASAPYHTYSSGYMEAIGTTGVFTRLIPTHNATAVASGTHYGDRVGSLRTAVIDVGDPEQVGDWGWLSYRTPPGQTDFKVTIRLLDADSEELLFERTDSRTNPAYNISLVPMDDHPRVVIEMLLENRRGFEEARVEHLEVNWSARLPEPPRMMSIAADNGTIYRTNTTNLRIQATDEMDRPQYLKLTVQMRPPGAGGWLSDRIGTPAWEDGNWSVPFTTTRDDPTGAYAFRAWVTDSDKLSSDPMEALDLVVVLNNPPEVPGIAIFPEEPLTGDDLNCTILRQAYDRDTSHVDYEYEWHVDGEEVPDLTNASVPRDRTEKLQTWEVRVRAFDGEDHGPWVEALTTILDSPPLLVGDFGPLELLEDDPPVVLMVQDLFKDPDDDPLTIEFSGEGPLDVGVDMERGRITITMPADWFGTQDVTFNVSDGNNVLSEVLRVRAFAVLDPPRVVSIGGKGPVEGRFLVNATQGEESVYLVVVEDVDSDRFRFRTDSKLGAFEVVSGNGTIIYTPANGEVGLRSFNLSVEDWEYNSVVVPVDVRVTNVNDPPGPVRIIQPKSAMTFEYDSTILFQGACEDPDERHGQVLDFTWTSDIDGVLDTGPNVQVTGLTPGDHTILLEVTDGEYTRDKSIKIRVKAAPVEPPNGGPADPGDEDPDVTPSSGNWLLWVLLALLLIVLVIGFVIIGRGRSRREAAMLELPAEDEEIQVVDGIPVPAATAGPTPVEEIPSSMEMMDGIMGRAPVPEGPEADIQTSPWSPHDLDISKQPMPATPPVGTGTAPDTSEWEEAEDEHVITPPLPPPPPPATSAPRQAAPSPPPPGIPSRQQPPRRPAVEEDEWEEVD